MVEQICSAYLSSGTIWIWAELWAEVADLSKVPHHSTEKVCAYFCHTSATLPPSSTRVLPEFRHTCRQSVGPTSATLPLSSARVLSDFRHFCLRCGTWRNFVNRVTEVLFGWRNGGRNWRYDFRHVAEWGVLFKGGALYMYLHLCTYIVPSVSCILLSVFVYYYLFYQ